MKQTIKRAVVDTIPVMTGYLVLGFGFGLLMNASGFSVALTAAMSVFIFAGSMQYAAVGLLTGGVSLITVALTTLMVNARHLFYGLSMLTRYQHLGAAKPYAIFALTDETYSLVCHEQDDLPQEEWKGYVLWVSLLDHIYWVVGSVLGAVAGALVNIPSEGIEFALTALFVTVFLEQWLSSKHHTPALIGVGASVLCLLIFGAERFLIPAMLVIALALCLCKDKGVSRDE